MLTASQLEMPGFSANAVESNWKKTRPLRNEVSSNFGEETLRLYQRSSPDEILQK